MVKRLVLFALAMVLCAPFACADERGEALTRVAKIDSQVGSYDGAVDSSASEEASIPAWLDDLLSKAPAEERVQARQAENTDVSPDEETQALQKDMESGLKTGSAPTDADQVFPRLPGIPPLYLSPAMEGEGVWSSEDTPVGSDGRPLVYKTFYRPSLDFANSVVYMAVFDMSRIRPRFFVGQTEPGIYQISQRDTEPEDRSRIIAITNAMWMQQHARGAGAIFRGQVVYPMVEGMATLVVYQDDSVDILEWTNDIPVSLVKDARQLRHLIVKDGKVVDQIVKHGKVQDAEIGLGGFLLDNSGRSTMANKFWFLANRTAFGIREDGNLVFAMAHHTGTKDLARALVLAGCKRAIHGDANIHNIVCNFYFRGTDDKVVKRDKLSPEQLKYTLNRYDQGYAKDFFAFYEK